MRAPENIEMNLPDPRSLGVNQPIILVADDEVMIRNLVTLLLQSQGYVVLSASDGQEGELSRKYPGTIDLVITDVEMPRLNGMDLRSNDPGIARGVAGQPFRRPDAAAPGSCDSRGPHPGKSPAQMGGLPIALRESRL